MVAKRRTDVTGGERDSCDCKVGRVRDVYGLEGLDEALVAHWRGDGREELSLRDLESYANRRMMRAAMTGAGMDPIDGEVENVYELLVGDRATEGTRTEVRNRLERHGVDVASLREDFVSHQTIHTHLRECLDVSKTPTDPDPAERRQRVADTVFALQNRTEAVTRGSLESLQNTDAVALEGFDVLVDVSVTCDSCGRVYDIGKLLDGGGCVCQHEGTGAD